MKRVHHMVMRARPLSWRTLIFAILIAFMVTMIVWSFRENTVAKAKKCFQFTDQNPGSIVFFEDVMQSKKQPTPGKSIFFHETSCTKDGLIHLNAR